MPHRVDFEVEICKALPALEEDSGIVHEGTFNADGGYGEARVYADKEGGDGGDKNGGGDGRRGGGYDDDDQY